MSAHLDMLFRTVDQTVYLRTATALQGPWTPDVKVYSTKPIDGGLVYAGVAHSYLDTTGRTLVVSFTNNNHVEVIEVTFVNANATASGT